MRPSSLDTALRQFEACEANLLKLERLWKKIESLIPSGIAFGAPPEYEQVCREFRAILEHLPAIDGWRLTDTILDYNAIGQWRLDAREIDEIGAQVAAEEAIGAPGRDLAEYRFRFDRKRRELVRGAVTTLMDQIDANLKALEPTLGSYTKASDVVTSPEVDAVKDEVKQIHTLLGSSVKRPAEWADLTRHLRFGQVHDFMDIIKDDWPKVRAALPVSVYGENDPLPVTVADLGEIVASRPQGPVVTKLNWDRLTPEDFERLIFCLISREAGYENPEWLMKTNAPDRGRDLSVYRVAVDPLSGSLRSRVIIQCKHWLGKSVSVVEIAAIKEQVVLWEPPRVNVLVIATSGRFTSDAVLSIEKHNEGGNQLRIEMWPESHLERLLAARPGLIAEFGLRKSQEDEIREALAALDMRALILWHKCYSEFMSTTSTGPDHVTRQVRDGVDTKRYYAVSGSVAVVRLMLDQVRLGNFPVMICANLDNPDTYVQCANLEEFVEQASKVVEASELWAAQQAPK